MKRIGLLLIPVAFVATACGGSTGAGSGATAAAASVISSAAPQPSTPEPEDSEAAATDVEESDAPEEDSDVCNVVNFSGMPALSGETANGDPAAASTYRGWGLYFEDVDRYLSKNMDLFKATVKIGDAQDRPANQASLSGVQSLLKVAEDGAKPLQKVKGTPTAPERQLLISLVTRFSEAVGQICPSVE